MSMGPNVSCNESSDNLAKPYKCLDREEGLKIQNFKNFLYGRCLSACFNIVKLTKNGSNIQAIAPAFETIFLLARVISNNLYKITFNANQTESFRSDVKSINRV